MQMRKNGLLMFFISFLFFSRPLFHSFLIHRIPRFSNSNYICLAYSYKNQTYELKSAKTEICFVRCPKGGVTVQCDFIFSLFFQQQLR